MIEHIEGFDKWLEPPKEKTHHEECMFEENEQCDCEMLREMEEEIAAEERADARRANGQI